MKLKLYYDPGCHRDLREFLKVATCFLCLVTLRDELGTSIGKAILSWGCNRVITKNLMNLLVYERSIALVYYAIQNNNSLLQLGNDPMI